MLTVVISGQRTHTCLFLFMPVRIPHVFYNGSMPNNILKVKVIKADSVPTLVKRAGCLWQCSGSAVGRLGPSNWSSRRFSGWHTTPVQRLSSSAGRAWGLRASSHGAGVREYLGSLGSSVWTTPPAQAPPPAGLGWVSFPQEPFLRGSNNAAKVGVTYLPPQHSR